MEGRLEARSDYCCRRPAIGCRRCWGLPRKAWDCYEGEEGQGRGDRYPSWGVHPSSPGVHLSPLEEVGVEVHHIVPGCENSAVAAGLRGSSPYLVGGHAAGVVRSSWVQDHQDLHDHLDHSDLHVLLDLQDHLVREVPSYQEVPDPKVVVVVPWGVPCSNGRYQVGCSFLLRP